MNLLTLEKRFNWISLYCDALKWGIVNEVAEGNYGAIIDLSNFYEHFCSWWRQQLSDPLLQKYIVRKRSRSLDNSSPLNYDLCYLYDLESELWGASSSDFMDWRRPDGPIPLEPFKFVLMFYLIERAQKLLLSFFRFLNYESKSITHKTIRDSGFNHFFNHEQLATWIPFPFNLSSLSTRITNGQADIERHKTYDFVGGHYLVIGKNHYADVLESALRKSITWVRERRNRPCRGSIHCYYFDTLWRYSEAYRYRLPLASDYLRENSFYWGFNLRWLGTAFIALIELWMFTCNSQFMHNVWHGYSDHSTSRILNTIQLPRWQMIKKCRFQICP
jgi:hypothetical protein